MQREKEIANHLIFGAGLIGGFMAGAFASVGARVSVSGRESMRQRFEGTLTVTDYLEHRAEIQDIPFVSAADADAARFDFIWITVKSTGLPQALADLRPFVRPTTVLIACQNGLGSDLVVQAAYPANPVLRAIMQANVAQLEDSHLHRGSEGDLFIQCAGHVEDDLAVQLNSDLLPCTAIKDIEAFAWAKLQLNIANAVNALADVPVKEMLEHVGYRRVIAAAMKELLSVCQAKQLKLPKLAAVPMSVIPSILRLPNWAFAIIGRKMMDIDPTVRTSMWWDLSQSRKTEVDYLNGAVVDEGARVGVDCPVNRLITDLVHQVEAGERRQGISAGDFLNMIGK